MSFEYEQKALSRTKIDLIVIKADYCSRTFGVAPCNAVGTKCYNTFPTCKAAAAYNKTTKDYKFTNIDKPLPFNLVRPYIKSLNELPTEIKEGSTVTRRLKVTLADEPDTDVGIDPYLSTRAWAEGTFWKKWLARNRNYKGRIIERYEGYIGLAENEFKLRFVGKIDNITLDKNEVTIEAVDLIKSLSNIKFPLISDIKLSTSINAVFLAPDEESMKSLSVMNVNDLCLRSDLSYIDSFSVSAENTASGSLNSGVYEYRLVAYDAYNRPFASSEAIGAYVDNEVNDNSIYISWTAVPNAAYYRIFKVSGESKAYRQQSNNFFIDDGGNLYPWTGTMSPPTSAERYFKYTRYNESYQVFVFKGYAAPWAPLWYWETQTREVLGWLPIFEDIVIPVSAAPIGNSGYIQIEKEIIYYSGVNGNNLTGCKRTLFDSSPSRHSINTYITTLLSRNPGNPFTHLKYLLTIGGIASAYRSNKFDLYEASWNSINFSLPLLVKETKLSDIFFDLVSALDCIAWQNEQGKVDILKHNELPQTYKSIDDQANIIKDSASVDLNEASRKTRWILYWNSIDYQRNIKEKEAYNRVNISVDAVAESANEYNDMQEDVQYSAWINDNCGTSADLNTYINALLLSRKNRTRNAQEIITLDVEMKDNDIAVGEVVKVSTDELQDIYGANYNLVQFRTIKKDEKGNKSTLKLLRKF